MKKISETISFFGSGPVAAASLRLLVQDFVVETVITKPKPVHHRGSFPVIDVAEELGLPIHMVSNKAELDQLITAKVMSSELAILIDFGIIVSQKAIDNFPLGIVNSHFSLLPEWRGADPISFAILSGQPKTGVSLMLIDAGMDTGMLITQKVHLIKPGTTTPSLTDELITLSHKLLVAYLPEYIAGTVKPRNQPHPDRATYSRKLTKEDGLIDWNKPAEVIEREIRAFIDWPKSRTILGDKDVILTKAYIEPSVDVGEKPGDVIVIKEMGGLAVTTSNGLLWIQRLKPAGKSEMTAAAFLAGNKIY